MKPKNIVIIGSDGKLGNFISNHLSENLKHHIINIDITNNKKQTDYECDIANEENLAA